MSVKPIKGAAVAGLSTNGLDLAISSITKQFGTGSIMKLGSTERLDIKSASFGNVAIDELLGGGGLPRGRIIEIFGPESSGKTTLCLAAIAAEQRLGNVCAVIDVEHALDPKWAATVGVDCENLLVSQPDSGEEALCIAETLIRSGAVSLLVVDSVAALITKAELDGEMGDATMGATARLMSQAMRRLTAVVSKSGCICIFTNQIREKIGVMFGNPETTSGGRALKFFSSVRIDVRKKDLVKEGDKVIGNLVKLKTVKNKIAPPFAECEVKILYDSGFCPFAALVDAGVASKVLEKKGVWISFNGELIGQGDKAAIKGLHDNPELAAKLDAAVRAKLAEKRKVVAFVQPEESALPVEPPAEAVNQ